MIYVIPLIIALVLITAMIKKLPSYELFINGAEAVSYTHLTLPTTSRV